MQQLFFLFIWFFCLFVYLFLQNDSLVRHWYEKADMQQRKKLRTDYYAVLRVSPIASEVFVILFDSVLVSLCDCTASLQLPRRFLFGKQMIFGGG